LLSKQVLVKMSNEKNHTKGNNNTLFCITKRYPRVSPHDRYEVDKRVVNLEIETNEPLSDEFYDALTNLLSAYCG